MVLKCSFEEIINRKVEEIKRKRKELENCLNPCNLEKIKKEYKRAKEIYRKVEELYKEVEELDKLVKLTSKKLKEKGLI